MSERICRNPLRLLLYLFPPVLLLCALLATASLSAQASAPPSGPAAHGGAMHRPGSGVSGYLPPGQIDFLKTLPPYPSLSSKEDEVDVATLRQWQQPVDSARWRLAEADANLAYSRFDGSFGLPINASSSPLLVHLLDRVEADITAALSGAKRYYNRPRPYQRFHFDHVCEFAQPPEPDMISGGNSYPSGHAAFGWAIALTLADVAPEKAQNNLARGREYSESRIVCAVHYPSDVLAGEILATAVFGRIDSQPEFQRDLSCAQQEYALANHARTLLGSECLALKEQLAQRFRQQ